LTHKTVGEAAGRRATVVAACAVSAVRSPEGRGEEELVDAKSPPWQGAVEAEDAEVDTPARVGVRSGDVEGSRLSPWPVLTTVAAVRAALADARDSGLDDVVVLGRCARCGRAGRVVHFDGELRARARAP
jgi:hypothetical protein